MSDDIYVAKESAFIKVDDGPYALQARVTTARAGHPILDEYPELFEVLVPTFEHEQKSAPRKSTGKAAS